MNKIIRKKTTDYTTISNVFLRDENLSLKAKGLLATIMGLPDNWEFSIRGLCAILKEGRTAIYSAIDELKNSGYCTVIDLRSENGQIAGNDYQFYEEPHPEEPYSENLHTDNQPQLNKQVIKETNNEINNEIHPIRPKYSKFVKPTLDEVKEYCKEKGYTWDAERFYDHYESNGWKVSGKSPMKNWMASVRNWNRNEEEKTFSSERNVGSAMKSNSRPSPDTNHGSMTDYTQFYK